MVDDFSEGRVVIVMGVTGSGKTTIGRLVAQAIGCSFSDADDFHSAANIEKMRRGIALTAEDRKPWIDALVAHINADSAPCRVLACSALTRAIRQRFRAETRKQIIFVYLEVDPAILRRRLTERKGHFAKVNLLDSQLATLERPRDAIVVDAAGTVEETCRRARDELAQRARPPT